MYQLRYLVIYLSLVVALVLMILPFPDWVQIYLPNWVALVLIYWSMALPKRVGLWFAFFTGIVLDTSQGTLLGQHSLALVIVIFINMNFHNNSSNQVTGCRFFSRRFPRPCMKQLSGPANRQSRVRS